MERCDGCRLPRPDVGCYWPDDTPAVWGLCRPCRERAQLLDPRIGHTAMLDQLFAAVHGANAGPRPVATAPEGCCPLCEGTGKFPRP